MSEGARIGTQAVGLHNACSFFSLTPGLWFFQKESTALLLEDMSGFWPSEHRELHGSYCLICKLSLLTSFSAPCPTSVPCCTFVPKAMTGVQTSVSECGGGAGDHLSGLGEGSWGSIHSICMLSTSHLLSRPCPTLVLCAVCFQVPSLSGFWESNHLAFSLVLKLDLL